MEEYEPVAEVSSAIGPILAVPLFLAGTELSEAMVSDPEYNEMLKHTSLCTRFLNDLGTYQKESSQGYVNAVLLHAHRNGGSTSMEMAKEEVSSAVVASRRELLRLVQEGSNVRRPCRELFWRMCKVAHLFYLQGDGFLSLQELMAAASAAVHEPLQVKLPSSK
jgi:ent-kaurene synthase